MKWRGSVWATQAPPLFGQGAQAPGMPSLPLPPKVIVSDGMTEGLVAQAPSFPSQVPRADNFWRQKGVRGKEEGGVTQRAQVIVHILLGDEAVIAAEVGQHPETEHLAAGCGKRGRTARSGAERGGHDELRAPHRSKSPDGPVPTPAPPPRGGRAVKHPRPPPASRPQPGPPLPQPRSVTSCCSGGAGPQRSRRAAE